MVSGIDNSCFISVTAGAIARVVMVTGMPGVVATLGMIVGLATPRVIAIGGIQVTCLLLVLCLVPVIVLKILVNMLWFPSAFSSLTYASKKLKSSSAAW